MVDRRFSMDRKGREKVDTDRDEGEHFQQKTPGFGQEAEDEYGHEAKYFLHHVERRGLQRRV